MMRSGKIRKIVNESSAATETYLAHQLPDKYVATATPVGLAALMLAKAMGANMRIGVEMNEYRVELAKKLGLVDYVFTPDEALEGIMKVTNGNGVERAIDASASDSGRQLAIRATREWGKIAFVGECGTCTFNPSPDIIHGQKTSIFQNAYRMADTRFAKAHVPGKVNGADHALFLLEYQHSLQIILPGRMNLHRSLLLGGKPLFCVPHGSVLSILC